MASSMTKAVIDTSDKKAIFEFPRASDSRSFLKESTVFADDPVRAYRSVIKRDLHLQGSSPSPMATIYVLIREAEMIKHTAGSAVGFFKKALSKVKDVVKIAYRISGSSATVWTFSKRFDRRTLYKIYDLEKNLVDNHYRRLQDESVNARYRFRRIKHNALSDLYKNDFVPLKSTIHSLL